MLWKKNMNGVFNSTLLHNNNVKIHLACQDDLYQKKERGVKNTYIFSHNNRL